MRVALPSMSPTTLLIWARASLICLTHIVQRATPPEVDDDGDEEGQERNPAEGRRGRLIRDHAEHRGDGNQRDQEPAERVRAHQPTAAAIASSDSGFSSEDRSPGSEPSAVARTARRTIFAERVRGRESTKITRPGANALPSRADTVSEISRSRSALGAVPGRRQQKIHDVSPFT